MDYPHDKYRNLRRATNLLIGILIVLPLAPIINRYIPPLMLGTWNFDLIISVIAASLITLVIVQDIQGVADPFTGDIRRYSTVQLDHQWQGFRIGDKRLPGDGKKQLG